MKRLNLGILKGTLLLFGGPYSNLQATLAMRCRAQQLAIPVSNIICTGDSVAYCAQPNETLDLIRGWGINLLMGNCEESLSEGAENCGCGFEAGTACDVLSNSWYSFASKTVSAQHKQWMRELPHRIEFEYIDKRYAVVHGGVDQTNQFIFQSTDAHEKLAQIKEARVDGIVAGHCGVPFTQIIDNKLWHNPGVIGMPANDGASHVWYSLWNDVGGQLTIEHCCLKYDFSEAQRQMHTADMNNGYCEALATGLWPSMDVLPDVEKAAQGQPIEESILLFKNTLNR